MAAHGLEHMGPVGRGGHVAGPEAERGVEIGQRLDRAAKHVQRRSTAMERHKIGARFQGLLEQKQGLRSLAFGQQNLAFIDPGDVRISHGVLRLFDRPQFPSQGPYREEPSGTGKEKGPPFPGPLFLPCRLRSV